MEKFTNEERTRYYGKRIGDIVSVRGLNSKYLYTNVEVVDYGFLDNNRIVVRLPDGTLDDVVAEWCDIITKVEDRANYLERSCGNCKYFQTNFTDDMGECNFPVHFINVPLWIQNGDGFNFKDYDRTVESDWRGCQTYVQK